MSIRQKLSNIRSNFIRKFQDIGRVRRIRREEKERKKLKNNFLKITLEKYQHIPAQLFAKSYADIIVGIVEYIDVRVDSFERYARPLGIETLKEWQIMVAIWNGYYDQIKSLLIEE